MSRINKADGFSAVVIFILVAVIAVLGITGWFVWQKNNTKASNITKPNTTSQANSTRATTQQKQNDAQADPTQGGKYLVISEWGTRVALPTAFQGKVAYKISQAQDPDTGLPLQGADIYVASSVFSANSCATTDTAVGRSVTVVTTYLRTDASQPFNSSRYKGTMKVNILQDSKYNYHLNYVVPDCLGGGTNEQLVQQLQDGLTHLQKL